MPGRELINYRREILTSDTIEISAKNGTMKQELGP